MAEGSAPGSAVEVFERVYAHVRANPRLQFGFDPPPHTPPPPGWFAALVRGLVWAWPVLRPLTWAALAAAAVAIGAWIVRVELRRRRRSAGTKAVGRLEPDPARRGPWGPTANQARALLQDVDALAAEHRFAEAVHLMLLRSVEDIQSRRPGLVRAALTSRDIAALDGLPAPARAAFAALAEAVEHSLFGGAPVDAAAFAVSRSAYEAFAFPQTWAFPS